MSLRVDAHSSAEISRSSFMTSQNIDIISISILGSPTRPGFLMSAMKVDLEEGRGLLPMAALEDAVAMEETEDNKDEQFLDRGGGSDLVTGGVGVPARQAVHLVARYLSTDGSSIDSFHDSLSLLVQFGRMDINGLDRWVSGRRGRVRIYRRLRINWPVKVDQRRMRV